MSSQLEQQRKQMDGAVTVAFLTRKIDMSPLEPQPPHSIEAKNEQNPVVEILPDVEAQSSTAKAALLQDALDSWSEAGVLLRSVGSLVIERETHALGRRLRELSEAEEEPPRAKKKRKSIGRTPDNGALRERVVLEEKLDVLLHMSSILVNLEAAHRQFRQGLFALIDSS